MRFSQIILGFLHIILGVSSIKVSLVLSPGEDQMKYTTANYFTDYGAKMACKQHKNCNYTLIPVETSSDIQMDPWVYALDNAAKQSDIILTLSYFASPALKAIAPRYPEKTFGIIDYDMMSEGVRIGNVLSVTFREDEMGYINGYYSALISSSQSNTTGGNLKIDDAHVYPKALGVLGGQEISTVKRFVNGFGVGVRAVCPECIVICGYGTGFSNADDEGTQLGLKFLESNVTTEKGAHLAGTTGLAMMKRLTDEALLVTGFGTDEWITNFASGLGGGSEYVASSILKRYDVAASRFVYAAINPQNSTGIVDGTLQLSMREGGMSMAPCHQSCDKIEDHGKVDSEITALMTRLMSGKVKSASFGIEYKTGDYNNDQRKTSCDKVIKENSGSEPQPLPHSSSSHVTLIMDFNQIIMHFLLGLSILLID